MPTDSDRHSATPADYPAAPQYESAADPDGVLRRYDVTVYLSAAAEAYLPSTVYGADLSFAHPVATDDDLRLSLTGSDPLSAADQAYAIGNRAATDDDGRGWPDDVRAARVGDLVAVTDDHATHLYRIAASGPVSAPEADNPVVPLARGNQPAAPAAELDQHSTAEPNVDRTAEVIAALRQGRPPFDHVRPTSDPTFAPAAASRGDFGDFDFWTEVIGDDLVVGGVAYSREEYQSDGEGGVERIPTAAQRTADPDPPPDHTPPDQTPSGRTPPDRTAADPTAPRQHGDAAARLAGRMQAEGQAVGRTVDRVQAVAAAADQTPLPSATDAAVDVGRRRGAPQWQETYGDPPAQHSTPHLDPGVGPGADF